jgi:hypothetical protein
MGMNQHQRTTERNRTDGGCLLVPIDLRLLEGRDLGSPGGRIHARATPPLSVPNLQLKSEGGGQGWRLRWLPLSPCRAFSVNSDYVFLDSSILLGGGGRQWRPGNGSFLRPKPKLPRGRCWARLSSPFTSLEGMGHATMWFLSCCERPSAP